MTTKPDYTWPDYLLALVVLACIVTPVATAIYAVGLRDPIGPSDIGCFALPRTVTGGRWTDPTMPDRCVHVMTPRMLAVTDEILKCVEQDFDPYRLSPSELAAFASLAYSTKQGTAVICDPSVSTLAAYLSRRYPTELACKQIMRWDYVSYYGNHYRMPWLTRRREREYDLCVTPWSPKW